MKNKFEVLKNEDEHSIRNKIVQIRNTLESIEDPDFTFKYTPVNDFEDKQNYPLDFQIYMEEIGETELALGGYIITWVETPQNPYKLKHDSNLWGVNTEDFEDDEIWDEPTNLKVKDTRVITYDIDASISYFDTRTNPFKFLNTFEDDQFPFFLSWLAYKVDPHLEMANTSVRLENILND